MTLEGSGLSVSKFTSPSDRDRKPGELRGSTSHNSFTPAAPISKFLDTSTHVRCGRCLNWAPSAAMPSDPSLFPQSRSSIKRGTNRSAENTCFICWSPKLLKLRSRCVRLGQHCMIPAKSLPMSLRQTFVLKVNFSKGRLVDRFSWNDRTPPSPIVFWFRYNTRSDGIFEIQLPNMATVCFSSVLCSSKNALIPG